MVENNDLEFTGSFIMHTYGGKYHLLAISCVPDTELGSFERSWALLRGADLHPHPAIEWLLSCKFSKRKYASHKQKSRSVWGCVPDEKYEEMIFLIIVKQFNTAQ